MDITPVVKLRARHWHKLEVWTDLITGYALNFVLVHTVLHWLGYEITAGQNASMGLILMFFAYFRKYFIRRTFNNLIAKDYGQR